MQVRSVRPAASIARRPVVTAAKPAAQPAKPATAPTTARPALADKSFGSDIFQSLLFGLSNLGTIIKLPGGISGLLQMLPKSSLGMLNIGMGGFNMYKDITGLKKENNTKKGDDYIRIGSNAALIGGGVALLAGAALAPWVPLVGAGVAAAGYLGRMVGVWQDETRW